MSFAVLGDDVVSIPTSVIGTDDSDNILITAKAVVEVKKIKAANTIADDYGLRLGVKGGGCSGMSYTLGFDAAAKENDLVYRYKEHVLSHGHDA